MSKMLYATKICAGATYVVLFGLLALAVRTYHSLFLLESLVPGQRRTHFWENLGLSCVTSVLLGALYSLGYLGGQVARALYMRRRWEHGTQLQCASSEAAEGTFEIKLVRRVNPLPIPAADGML